MSIIIQESDVKFTKIANILITDKRLTPGAKILYCYLRSKPTNWKVINSDIIKTLQVSQETVAKYFKELISSGWIERKKETNEKGQLLGGYVYFLFDLPKETKYETKPDTEKTLIREKPLDINNTNIINKTNTTNNTNTLLLPTAKKAEISIKPIIDEIYELFKSIYKKHTGNDYMPKKHEFVHLTSIVKQFNKEIIINKVYLFEAMCKNKVNYFTKRGFADFTLGKLVSQWNEIVVDKKETTEDKEIENIFDKGVIL